MIWPMCLANFYNILIPNTSNNVTQIFEYGEKKNQKTIELLQVPKWYLSIDVIYPKNLHNQYLLIICMC